MAISGTRSDTAAGAVAPNGSVLVSGKFSGTLRAGPFEATPPRNAFHGLFLLRLDPLSP